MAMRPKLLARLIAQATKRRDEAAARAARSRAELADADQTLRNLVDFADQKAAARRAAVGGTTDVVQQDVQTRFAKKLNTATALQRNLVDEREQVHKVDSSCLQTEQRGLLSLQVLAERAERRRREAERRSEQRANDEVAAQMSLRKATS